MNLTQVPVYSGHIGGASVQCLVHYLQLSRINTFSWYDYGPEGNMIHYNSTTAPVYDLTKVNVPVALFSGDNDNFADPVDVQRYDDVTVRKQKPESETVSHFQVSVYEQ